jgi:hypothetical protein
MNRNLSFFAILIAILFIASCSDGSKTISEIKLIPVKNGKDFQYIDMEGKIVINPQFSEATIFRNGLALVKSSGEEPQWGFISEDGKYAITPKYKSATVFNEDLAWVVSENAPPAAINSKGEIKFSLQNAEKVINFSESLAAFSIIDSSGEKWGFVNKEGKVVINPQFNKTGRFSEGRCAVENNEGKWGFIDKEGKITINYQFTKTGERFINSKAVVYLEDKAGVIDETGKFVINPQFSSISCDGENYLIEQDQKWGWCDKDGKIIINPQFGKAFPFTGNKLAAVQSGKSWGYIDIEGKIIINPQFDMALPYNGKLAVVLSSGKVGFIDAEGKYLINPQFDDVSSDLVTYLFTGWSEYESVVTDFFNVGAIVNRININAPEGLLLSSKLSDVISFIKKRENSKNSSASSEEKAAYEAEMAAAAAAAEAAAVAGYSNESVSNDYAYKFNSYSNQHELFSNERITNDARVSFYVVANAYMEIPNGWYTQMVFNPDAGVQGYVYAISLSGKGYGKEKDVKDAIEKNLIGYKKDETLSTEEMNIFKNKNQTIKSYINGSQIIIAIISNQNETVQNDEYGD